MKTRFILRLLTLSSWLPLAACATSDSEDVTEAQPENVTGPENADVGLNEENDAGANGAKSKAAVANAANANDNESTNDDLLGDEGNDEVDDEFADENVGSSVNAGPAADAGKNIANFENDGLNIAADAGATIAGNGAAIEDEGIDSFKGSVGDADPFANPNAASNGPNSVVANAAIPEVAPVVSAPAVPGPAAPRPPEPPATAGARPVASPSADGHDVTSTPSVLHWVGYKINEGLRKLEIELATHGKPEFEIFEQSNRAHQNEIIIRLYNTKVRKKISWDIDSSEFRSPVAYVRMRKAPVQGVVDVVITHRDNVQPMFFHKDGTFLLSYTVPDRYFGPAHKEARVFKDRAVTLNGSDSLAPPKIASKGLPNVGFTRYVSQFKEVPKLVPIARFIRSAVPLTLSRGGLPRSFDKRLAGKKTTGVILSRNTLVGVAQENLENPGENANLNNENGNNANTNSNTNANAKASDKANANSNDKANANTDDKTNAGANDKASGNFNGSPGNFNGADKANDSSGLETGNNGFDEPEAFGDEPAGETKAGPDTIDDFADGDGTAPVPAAVAEPIIPTKDGGEIEAEHPAKTVKYNGKPVFMEFYDSPLSIVLKGFSEETGNNFIFSNDIGSLPVSISFKGVPWDEALRAILETNSLGMIRIGENVVRIDRIANLSSYLQALETANEFQTRRLPTKVVVYRVNNAKAAEVKGKLTELLSKDMKIDDRIKVSEDVRTNAVVIEAPQAVLVKARSIIERLDLETPQVEITSRIVEVQKTQDNVFGIAWGNNLNFDPGRALGFGTLNFPNSVASSFSVDPGVNALSSVTGTGRFRFGSLNRFLNLDLLLRLEEKKGTTNVLQSNRILVLDGQKASINAGSSQFFRPAAGGTVINGAGAAGGAAGGAATLAEVKFDLSLSVTPQVTALGNVIMTLDISSDTPGDPNGESLASKNTRKLITQMVRASGDTGVIGGIYDTKRRTQVTGIPFLSDLPIIGALFRSSSTAESQQEMLIMVTPTIISGPGDKAEVAGAAKSPSKTVISKKTIDKSRSVQ